LDVDIAASASNFKNAVYNVTGVPAGERLTSTIALTRIDRMKVMVKGGILKVKDRFLLTGRAH
jgi:hypothetical protein